ncbi:MAG: HAMP domain-containing protein [Bosea sp.]|jgi:methyl-accepting chemotaxis protein|nr:HAMP domain-containing protein [Bosea sp. (in: a-proteobacteria)]
MLRHISVFARIALLAAIGLAAVVTVSAFALHARGMWLHHDARTMRLEEMRRSILELGAELARSEARFLEFAHLPMEHLGERFKSSLAAVIVIVERARAQAEGALVPQLFDLQISLENIRAEIDSVQHVQAVVGSTRNTGLRGELAAATLELESAVRAALATGMPEMQPLATGVQAMIRGMHQLMVERDVAVEAELTRESDRMLRLVEAIQAAPVVGSRLAPALRRHAEGLSAWTAAVRALDGEMLKVENALTLLHEPLNTIRDGAETIISSHRKQSAAQLARDESAAAFGALVLLLGCLLLALLVIRSISEPLEQLRLAMERIARGEAEAKLHGQDAHDEIGAMTRAAAIFRDAMLARQRMSETVVHQAEQRGRSAASVAAAVGQFDKAVSAVLSGLGEAGANLGASSEHLDRASQVVTERTRMAQDATETMTSRITTVASATEELSSTIAAIAQGTGRAASAADGAILQVDQTEQRMRDLLATSSQIGDVVTLIRQIASQTNLLALNATIEAARAGESGRGFAIVAAEVKTLAAQTQSATEEIGRKIEAIQSGANNMSGSIHDMSRVVLDMREIAVEMSAAIRQQDATVIEIASTMAMLAEDASLNLSSVRDTAHAAQAADEVAREVRQTADDMRAIAARLADDVAVFVDRVRNDAVRAS